jgi:hypothetical protein
MGWDQVIAAKVNKLEDENKDLRGKLDKAMATAKEACGGSEPSSDYTYVDELAGLLRVTRGQRDGYERTLRNHKLIA